LFNVEYLEPAEALMTEAEYERAEATLRECCHPGIRVE